MTIQPTQPPVTAEAALYVAQRQMQFDAGEKLQLAARIAALEQLVAQQKAEIERLTATPTQDGAQPVIEEKGGA